MFLSLDNNSVIIFAMGRTIKQPKNIAQKAKSTRSSTSKSTVKKREKSTRTARKKKNDVAEILKERKDLDDLEERVCPELKINLANATAKSKKHQKKGHYCFSRYKGYLEESSHWKPHMTLVVNDEGRKIPKLFRACSESYDVGTYNEKRRLANDSFVDFASQLKQANGNDYQPSSHSQMLRTLVSYMADHYDWNFTIDGDFNFDKGGLADVCALMYRKRREEDSSGKVSN